MALSIRWSSRATRQLEAIIEYIAGDSPRYATIFTKRVMQVFRAIPANPKLGRMVPEYADPDLRERILQSYRIVYRLKPNAIEIVTVCHGSRLIGNVIEEPTD
jgi:plasmid stabilization system protein ParE